MVPTIASVLSDFTGDDLLIVQTVLVQDYWKELEARFAERQDKVVHVLLDASAKMLEAGIREDSIEATAETWRLEHVRSYQSARGWLLASADLVVPTDILSVADVVPYILDRLG